MSDFYEIDFLGVGEKKSGDAIALRYSYNGVTRIHVTDGGYLETGDALVKHIRDFYGNPSHIDAVVVSHPDGDHAAGLRKLFSEFTIGELWMLRPWEYAGVLLPRFSRFKSVENLTTRLKELYPNITELESLAIEYGVPIREPFQGESIGQFLVMSPTVPYYLDLIVQSDKTPDATSEQKVALAETIVRLVGKAVQYVRAVWGAESFPADDTSAENNMSVIQYTRLCGDRILLTADAGRASLTVAGDYAEHLGLPIHGLEKVQIPHHGSRHNISSELLDRWLGPRLIAPQLGSQLPRIAIVSTAKEDKDHPRKSVIRAFIHRGYKVYATEGSTIQINQNAPRNNWFPVQNLQYPEEQES
ncbi:MBL fold metallo-hydrolase [bacterium]|nr:MBL fold metallo-hydrolase [bacterium]